MVQWIIAAIGAQTVGGVLVPLNTRLKGPEAAYILRASGARISRERAGACFSRVRATTAGTKVMASTRAATMPMRRCQVQKNR